MKSVFARHYLWLCVLTFSSLLITGLAFLTASGAYIRTREVGLLMRNAQITADMAAALQVGGKLPQVYQTYIMSAAALIDAHILVCDPDGQVVLCSDENCALHVGLYVPESFAAGVTAQGKFSRSTDLGGIYPSRYNVAAVAVYDQRGNTLGFVTAASSENNNQVLINLFGRMFALIAVIILWGTLISAYFVSKKLTHPIKLLSESAKAYARGDFTPRVPVRQGAVDEVSLLVTGFNAMADSLTHLEDLRREFIANVSHELRTPMTVITGYVDGIIDGTIKSDDAPRYLTIISDEVRRLSRMVARMLEITQLQSGQSDYNIARVNLCEVVRRVILGFEPRVEDKNIEVECNLPDQDIWVLFDPDALTQVITNLCDNAVKFTPQNGFLGIDIQKRQHRALIKISNSGDEIPEDDLPFVFDRFHKADKSRASDRAGLGLGLYIVKNIISHHEETIQVTSADGITTFEFTAKLTG